MNINECKPPNTQEKEEHKNIILTSDIKALYLPHTMLILNVSSNPEW